MRSSRKWNKVVSIVLVLVLVLGLVPMGTVSANATDRCVHDCVDGTCSYAAGAECLHAHDGDCGYSEESEGAICTFEHIHDDACSYDGENEETCAFDLTSHIHDDLCGYVSAALASPCIHDCGDGVCGYSEPVSCDHVCGESCVESEELEKSEELEELEELAKLEDLEESEQLTEVVDVQALADSILPLTADGAVCSIDGVGYADLTSALDAVQDGETIKLLANIDHDDGIVITNKSITFDLNGKILNVKDTTRASYTSPVAGLEVGSGGEVRLAGSGSFNVEGEYSSSASYIYGVYVHDGGKATVTNATSKYGNTSSRGAYASGVDSEITVLGDASGIGGASAESGAKITVVGNATGIGQCGADAQVDDASILVYGNVISQVNDGVRANGGFVEVRGNVTGATNGAYAQIAGSTIVVYGNVSATGANAYGVYAQNGGVISVGGDASASNSNSYGVCISTQNINLKSQVTIEGTIQGGDPDSYIWGNSVPYGGTDQIGNIAESQEKIPTTKEDYRTYMDGNEICTVWVRGTPDTSIDYGLIFDATAGKLFLDKDGNGIVSVGDSVYKGQTGKWSAGRGKLRLDGFGWKTGANKALIIAGGGEDVVISLKEGTTNSFASTSTTGLSAGIDLIYVPVCNIGGGGTLNATGGEATEKSFGIHGLYASGGGTILNIQDSTVNATGGDAVSISCGIAVDRIKIESGEVIAIGGDTPSATSRGIYTNSYVGIENSKVTAKSGDVTGVFSNGISTNGLVEIYGGEVTAKGSNTTEGFGIYAAGKISIYGDSVEASGFDGAFNTAPMVSIAPAYTWWENIEPTDPGGNGTVYASGVSAYKVPYTHEIDQKYVKIVKKTDLPTLGGTLNISVFAINGVLVADPGSITGGKGAFSYVWSGKGVTDSGEERLPAANYVLGSPVTLTVTRADAMGSLKKEITVYRVDATLSGGTGTDKIDVNGPYGVVGYSVPLMYTLGDTGSQSNTLTYSGVAKVPTQVTIPGTGQSDYTIAATDAVDGVISIKAAFAHTDKPPAKPNPNPTTPPGTPPIGPTPPPTTPPTTPPGTPPASQPTPPPSETPPVPHPLSQPTANLPWSGNNSVFTATGGYTVPYGVGMTGSTDNIAGSLNGNGVDGLSGEVQEPASEDVPDEDEDMETMPTEVEKEPETPEAEVLQSDLGGGDISLAVFLVGLLIVIAGGSVYFFGKKKKNL